MATKLFVNLPVKDLNKAMDFFTKLGYRFNPQFTNEMAAAMIISDDIYAMLLTEPMFKNFSKKEIGNTATSSEVILALSAENRQEVDELVNKAFDAGAKASSAQMDHGFMYQWGFEDLDGHLWEVFWMDPAHVQ